MNISWYSFDELTPARLYAILALRQSVFIVEQRSIYEDIDFSDQTAHHLVVTERPDGPPSAYLRCLPPGPDGAAAFGRVAVAPDARGRRLGKRIVACALERLARDHPAADVVIGAQAHLAGFYGGFGFVAEGTPYDDGGILHRRMRLRPGRCGTAP